MAMHYGADGRPYYAPDYDPSVPQTMQHINAASVPRARVVHGSGDASFVFVNGRVYVRNARGLRRVH